MRFIRGSALNHYMHNKAGRQTLKRKQDNIKLYFCHDTSPKYVNLI